MNKIFKKTIKILIKPFNLNKLLIYKYNILKVVQKRVFLVRNLKNLIFLLRMLLKMKNCLYLKQLNLIMDKLASLAIS